MLVSSALVLVVMTVALFCTQVPASASSYGIMGGGSDGSSKSSSRSYYRYVDSSRCNSGTRVKKPCSICDCHKEKNQGKPKSCTECSCYEEKECRSGEVSSWSCNCDYHRPCGCTCHVSEKTIAGPLFIIFCVSAVIYVVVEEDKIANNGPPFGVDNRWGSVIMVQVAILDKKRVLQRKLNRIAGTADTETKSSLNCVLKVVKSLYEHQDQCRYAYLYAMYNHLEKSSRPCFRGMLEMEAGKFDKNNETFVNVDGVRYRKESAGEFKSIDNEYSVVTLLVLVHGEYLIPSLKGNTTHVKKVEVKNALETIHSIPRSDLEAVKVLWTPQRENDVVSEQEVCRDFGLLMRPIDTMC
ncbi:hypothetical protein ACET3Z_006278 [Daucus carota]